MFIPRTLVLAAATAALLSSPAAHGRPNPHQGESNQRYDVAGCRNAHQAHEAALRARAEEHCRKDHKTALERFEYKPVNCDFSVRDKPPTHAVGQYRFSCAEK